MNRLIGVVMVATLATSGIQLAGGEAPTWASVVSLTLLVVAVLLAATTTVPNAVRLGSRTDPAEVQRRLARSILRDHLICLGAISALIVIQLSFAT